MLLPCLKLWTQVYLSFSICRYLLASVASVFFIFAICMSLLYCNKRGQLHVLRKMWAEDYNQGHKYKRYLLRQILKDSDEHLDDDKSDTNTNTTDAGATGEETTYIPLDENDVQSNGERVVYDKNAMALKQVNQKRY